MQMNQVDAEHIRAVRHYENLYAASDDGRIFECKSGAEVTQHMAMNGTMYVQLAKNGTIRNKKVAYIVAQAFVENPDKLNLKAVRHKDGNKQNNEASNLFWTRRTRRKEEYHD